MILIKKPFNLPSFTKDAKFVTVQIVPTDEGDVVNVEPRCFIQGGDRIYPPGIKGFSIPLVTVIPGSVVPADISVKGSEEKVIPAKKVIKTLPVENSGLDVRQKYLLWLHEETRAMIMKVYPELKEADFEYINLKTDKA